MIYFVYSTHKEYLLSLIYHIVARRLGLHCCLCYKSEDTVMAILSGQIYYRANHSIQYFYRKWGRSSLLSQNTPLIVRGICRLPLDPLHNILQIRNLVCDFRRWANCINLCTNKFHEERRQVSYKWNMMYILNFLLRCLSDIKDIHMDYEYTYITRSIKDPAE
ncbi:uncharacterized protein LOC112637870 [Camponotus floridanus]|uniref:uncharacterized protein LOC112637869 n=1 Tax=Camponotus floridanus TaxID=104421 RepID=UPI000DC69622|nr:uncharacterized protein LOC112637869 [Camponotus floridanus]XP_025264325.1 uncharacterized protein LOC112637870 [Camponotus floridanus]